MIPAAIAPLKFGPREWVVVGATVGFRLAAIGIASHAAAPWIDPDGYLTRAAALTSRDVTWLQALTDPDGLTVPPLYSAALAAAQRVGLTPSIILVAQAALAGLTSAAVLAMARFVAGRGAALFAGWCFALSAPAIAAAPAFWSEALYVPLAASGLALLLIAVRGSRPGLFGAAGFVFAAAALTRSLPIYVLPAMAAVIYVRAASARRSVILMLGVFAVLVGSYVAAVSAAAGRFMLVENSPEWHWNVNASSDAGGSRAGLASVFSAIARDAAASPVTFVHKTLAHVRAVFSGGHWNGDTATQFPPGVLRVLYAMGMALLAIVVIFPIPGLLVAPNRTEAWVLVAWVAVQIPLIALSATSVGPRYRAPLDLALLPLAAAATSRLYLVVRARGIGGAGRLAQW